MPRKQKTPEPTRGISVAVTEFLSELRLGRSERVMGALALMLAESLEQAPVYARAPLAGKLYEVMAKLAEAETDAKNLSLLQGVEL